MRWLAVFDTPSYALCVRRLIRDRGFSVTAALTLAVGIGLSTAVFTVAHAVLLRDLPVHEQERLVVLWRDLADGSFAGYPLTYEQAREFASSSRALERTAWFAYQGSWPAPIRDGDRLSPLRQALVSGDFFDVLGARPLLGRGLMPQDDRVGARPVSVLSYRAWQRVFGGREDVLGQSIVVHQSGLAHEIIGVMPEGLDAPGHTDFWTPIVPATTKPGDDKPVTHVHLVGRLAAGTSIAAARDELNGYFGRTESPDSMRRLRAIATPLPLVLLGDVRPAVIAFAAASVLLLLITSINVANLLLVRALARHREFAVRLALGSGRLRLARELIGEHAVLAAIGGVLGIAVAAVALRLFVTVAPQDIPRLGEIRFDATALAAAVSSTLVALLVFGVAPAISASRVGLDLALRGTRDAGSRASRRVGEGLVVGQLALAVLVLSAAGLIVRSLVNLERADLALDPSNVLIAELAVRAEQTADRAKQRVLVDRVLSAVRALPDVVAASPVVAAPFTGLGGWDGQLTPEGVEQAGRTPMLNLEVVVPEYFDTLNIPVQSGRLLTADDKPGAPPVVVLSETAARAFWPGESAVGRVVRLGKSPFTVVGVVRDTRYRDLRVARPTVYFPWQQSVFPFAPLALAIRTRGEPAALVPSLRRAIVEAEPGVGLAGAEPFDTHLDRPLQQPRLNALLLMVFAGAAVVLAAIGQFGVMATMVRQRTRELGVRMALGATASDLRRIVMGRGLALALAGTTLGLALAGASNGWMASMLYGVSPSDSSTLIAVGGVLVTIATAAAGIAARAGTRIDPVVALRSER
jgi:putative ABC transport system permease protein